jgi:uncharacterized repeat protein (TIGR01451 family)
MRPLRPAGLLAGLMLLAALPTSSIAGGARAVVGGGSVRAAPPAPCGQPGTPPCPPSNSPVIAIAKSASPTSLPAGGGPVTYTYTVTNAGPVPIAGVTVTDDKCAPVTFVSGDTNGNTILDITETWTFTCTTTLTTTTLNTATATGKDASGAATTAFASTTVTVRNSPPDCPPGSTDPHCVPPPCPPGTTGPNCPPPPPPPPKTTLVWECFDLQSRLVPNKTVLLVTKNFGNDTVHVLKSQRMCEPALKTQTQPPTGATAPVVLPNAELSLDLMDPQGGRHTVMFDGTMAYMKLGAPIGPYDTEMLKLSLESTSPMRVAAPAGSFFDSFFDVFLELDAAAPSPGRLGSFFDVFTEMSLSHSMSLGGASLHLMPSNGLRFINDQGGRYMLSPAAPIPLNGPNGQPTGWTVGGGILVPTPTPTPTPVVTRVLECFQVEGGTTLHHVYQLRTANFGLDVVRVERSDRLCEGAIKSRQPLTAAAAVPQPAPIVWECWNITSARRIQPTRFYLNTRNFRVDPVVVIKPHSLCEEAQKIRISAAGTVGQTIGQPTGRVLECFTIEAKTRNVPFFLWTRNFGQDVVRVGRGTLLCEPAEKRPLGTNSPSTRRARTAFGRAAASRERLTHPSGSMRQQPMTGSGGIPAGG